jgi:alkylated DNA nucleotide flippase Atl1
MPRKKTTWTEKLADDKDFPKVGKITGNMSRRWGTGTMVIPAPRQVDAVMRTVRRGRLITINKIRDRLAAEHKVSVACPMTTGIFAWIAAHAAAEQEAVGKKRVTPWWRTLKSGGELNPKYPGGIEAQRRLLRAEGHKIIQKGKRWLVADYEKSLVN